MTEQDRISRETLLKRAAVAAGAVYVAPVLTSSGAAASACSSQPCRHDRKCRRLGGRACKCINGRCGRADGKECGPRCCFDGGCGPLVLCDESGQCDRGDCACLTNTVTGLTNCVEFPSGFCADYEPCSLNGGHRQCPPGMCCMSTCCPEGICMTACGAGTQSRISRSSGSGATLTL